MNRGIVMESGRRSTVVMTPDGEFVKISGSGWAIGEEISFEREARRQARRRSFLLTASAAVILLVAFTVPRLQLFDRPHVAAYVTLDINPSVELGVDNNRSVVELHALNPDGEAVIQGVAYKKKPVGEVTAAIIENAEAANYLRDGGEVFVTSMVMRNEDETFEDQLTYEVGSAVQSAAVKEAEGAAEPAVEVRIVRAPGELREKAQESGVSPGAMAVYLLAEEQGLPISLDMLKSGSIRQAAEPYGGIAGVLGGGPSEADRKRELAELLEKKAAQQSRPDAAAGRNAGSKREQPSADKAERQAKREAEQAARKAERQAKREAEHAARQAERQAKREAEQAERKAERQAKREAEQAARQAERQSKREAEQQARKAERQTKREAEQQARQAERQAKREAEKARQAERQAKREAEQSARKVQQQSKSGAEQALYPAQRQVKPNTGQNKRESGHHRNGPSKDEVRKI